MKIKELLTQARGCARNCDPKGLSVSGPNFKVTEYFRAPHLLGEVADRLEVVQECYEQAISSSVTWEARAIKEASRAADLQAHVDELLAALGAAERAMTDAHNSMFNQCCSNPITNAWDREIDVSLVNAMQLDARRALDTINKITGETK